MTSNEQQYLSVKYTLQPFVFLFSEETVSIGLGYGIRRDYITTIQCEELIEWLKTNAFHEPLPEPEVEPVLSITISL